MSTHFDSAGNPQIVDVSSKPISVRIATAEGQISLLKASAVQIRTKQSKKGDVLAVAHLAAIQATKLTDRLIPLCHSIPIEAVSVDFDWPETTGGTDQQDRSARSNSKNIEKSPPIDIKEILRCRVTVRTTGKTGVEMEAMTGVATACLTVYDMLKSIDRAMVIGPIELVRKSGGKSGDYERP